MTSQCRNYMQQYTRTKSIREVNKTRSSYKQLLQNSKTRQNSTATAHLRLSSAQKKSGQKQVSKSKQKRQKSKQRQKIQRNLSVLGNYLTNENCGQFCIQNQPLLSSTQNMHNITNISYGKLNSKMKLKVAAQKCMRSMSSNQQLLKYQNNGVASSMVNIGVGLSSNKKKPKLVTLTSSHHPSSTAKKTKMYKQLNAISNHQEQSRSISQSHNNSIINSKYSTSIAHQAAYKSIKRQIQDNSNQNQNTNANTNTNTNTNMNAYTYSNKQKIDKKTLQRQKQKQRNKSKQLQNDKKITQNNRLQIITLNSSMIFDKDKQKDKDFKQINNLDLIYNRIKLILNQTTQKQKQWNLQRDYYQARIKQLQRQVQQVNRKSITNNNNRSTSINVIDSFSTNFNSQINRKQTNRRQSNYINK